MPENLRRVIREHRFERELRRLVADAVGADEFVADLTIQRFNDILRPSPFALRAWLLAA